MSSEEREKHRRVKAFTPEELEEYKVNNGVLLFLKVRLFLIDCLSDDFGEFGIDGLNNETSLSFPFTDSVGIEHNKRLTKSELIFMIKHVMKEQNKKCTISTRLVSNRSSDYYIVVNVIT